MINPIETIVALTATFAVYMSAAEAWGAQAEFNAAVTEFLNEQVKEKRSLNEF